MTFRIDVRYIGSTDKPAPSFFIGDLGFENALFTRQGGVNMRLQLLERGLAEDLGHRPADNLRSREAEPVSVGAIDELVGIVRSDVRNQGRYRISDELCP